MTLHELITGEPTLAQHIASGNDGAIAEWLNTPSVTVTRNIPINAFVGELFNTGAFAAILQAAALGNQTAGMAVTLIEKAKALGIEGINVALPINQGMLATLVSDGTVTQAQVDSAVALSNVVVSPAESAGLGYVSLLDIANWRLSNG